MSESTAGAGPGTADAWSAGHFQQNHHAVHRLRRYGAPAPTNYENATPQPLADEIFQRVERKGRITSSARVLAS